MRTPVGAARRGEWKSAGFTRAIRDWFTGDYIVRYLILDDRIVILRVWHGKEERG